LAWIRLYEEPTGEEVISVRRDPVLVLRFIRTRARVYLEEPEDLEGDRLKVETWERPKPSGQHLGRAF
jgi:hypothetical protein